MFFMWDFYDRKETTKNKNTETRTFDLENIMKLYIQGSYDVEVKDSPNGNDYCEITMESQMFDKMKLSCKDVFSFQLNGSTSSFSTNGDVISIWNWNIVINGDTISVGRGNIVVNGNSISVWNSSSFSTSPKIVLYLSTSLKEIEIKGSGNVTVDCQMGDLDIKVNWSGDITIEDWMSSEVNILVSGSGDIICNHVAKITNIKISGSGDVTTPRNSDVNVMISGSGDVEINDWSKVIMSKITGSGEIM